MVATMLGLLAALAPSPSDANASGLTRIELFAPLGLVDEAPTSLHWMSPVPASFARVRVVDDAGVELVARTVPLAPGSRSLRFTDAERTSFAAAGSGWIEVLETAETLELLARSTPGRFALRRGGG